LETIKDNKITTTKIEWVAKQRIDNLLDAVSNEEKKVQEKCKRLKVQGKPQKRKKD
jgi:hypothetical protein